jgi:hypothetical protein
MNTAGRCTFCEDVRAGRYKEFGLMPGLPLISDNGSYVERAMRELHDGGRRNAAKELGYLATAGLLLPFSRSSENGLYLPTVDEAAKSLQQYGDKTIDRRNILQKLLLGTGLTAAASDFGCGGGGGSDGPPPPPPPPQTTTVSLNIKDISGNPVTTDNFRFKYGATEKDTVQNTSGKYVLTFDKTTNAQQSEARTGQPIAGGTTPWYRMTRSEGSILLNDTVLADGIALMRVTESGNTTLYRHLLNLYRYMTIGDGSGLSTKLQKYPTLTSQNGVDVNLNHILGVDQYVNAARNSALPAWAASLPQGKKLYSEVTQNPSIGLYFTYANRGTSAPSFNTILKPPGTDSNGNPAVKNFEIEVNTAWNVNQSWIEVLVHELGHAVLCLFREDPDVLRTHVMSGGGVGRTIQPIEFGERDWQAYLINAHDMGLYPLETS